MIYNNDLLNINGAESPYNPPGPRGKFTDGKIRASVAEAAVPGMGAQLIAPGYGWVPLWKSKLVPLAGHEAWFRSHYGAASDHPAVVYIREGGDLVGTFIDECHKHNNAALASFRVNDGHVLDMAFAGAGKVAGWQAFYISRFYVGHPELRRTGANFKRNGWADRVHDWSQPAAPAHKEALLRELIETHPLLDGVELDFQRAPHFFPPKMPMKKRVGIMCDFLKKIRALLDEGGARRTLGVRIPLWPDAADNNNNERDGSWRETGFDPAAWLAAGVDYFNFSPSYRLSQDMRGVARARREAPSACIFAELTHSPVNWTLNIKTAHAADAYANITAFRRATKELLQTTARLAYTRGADGISLFNFHTYRASTSRFRDKRLDLAGPFNEPPFAELPALLDRPALDAAPSYFLKHLGYIFTSDFPSRALALDLVPARGNSVAVLRLLILTNEEYTRSGNDPAGAGIDRGDWRITFNGAVLRPLSKPMSAYPFPTPYQAGFNQPEQYLAWLVPAGAIKNGVNQIRIETTRLPETLRARHLEIIQLPAGDAGAPGSPSASNETGVTIFGNSRFLSAPEDLRWLRTGFHPMRSLRQSSLRPVVHEQ
jgi:hypothetical protein